jgi:hypothetical protein
VTFVNVRSAVKFLKPLTWVADGEKMFVFW